VIQAVVPEQCLCAIQPAIGVALCFGVRRVPLRQSGGLRIAGKGSKASVSGAWIEQNLESACAAANGCQIVIRILFTDDPVQNFRDRTCGFGDRHAILVGLPSRMEKSKEVIGTG
jgi:hypothetical protein